MDAELSHRLAWYFAYLRAAEGVISEDRRRTLVQAAEESQVFSNLPVDIKSEIMEAELDYSAEEYPYIPVPWPLRGSDG